MIEMAVDHNDPAIITTSPVPGILVSGHFTETFGYRVYRSKGTRDWLITFTLSGTGVYHINGDVLHCRAGDIFILPPGSPHHYAAVEGEAWEFVWSHFLPHPDWSRYLQLPEASKGLMHMHIAQQNLRQRLYHVFERLIQDEKNERALREKLCLNALEEILLLIAQSANTARYSMLDPRIEEVLHLISASLHEQHSVASLARSVSLSPSRLAHLFKEQTGDSIIETLLKLRLRHAARLLEYTTMPVAEAAEEVGFRSPFYFTKQFKTFFGCSPTDFREKKNEAAQKADAST